MRAGALATYAWKTDTLAAALKQQALSERDQFALILLGQVVVFVAAYIGLFMGIARDWPSVVEAFVLLTITVVGIPATYRANGGEHGQDFVRSFFILSIPLAVKFSLVSWLIFYALSWAVTLATVKMTENVFELAMRVFEFLWNIGLTTLFYWRLAHWMKIARHI